MTIEPTLGGRLLRGVVALAASAALVASGAGAASASTVGPAASSTLSGTITDASTGVGIEGASIVVLTTDGVEAASATTGSTGGYTVSELAAGDYRVSISSAPRYEPVFWPAATTLDGAEDVTVATGESRTEVDAALVATAIPAPAAIPTDGATVPVPSSQPVLAAAVQPEAAAGASDRGSISGSVPRYWSQTSYDLGAMISAVTVSPTGDLAYRATTWTDESDRYQLSDIPPGEYLLYMEPISAVFPAAATFYPAAPTAAQAQRITVSAGADLTGYDFSLSVGGDIFGDVSDAAGPVYDATAVAYRWNGGAWETVSRVTAWGAYSFTGDSLTGESQRRHATLPTGTYTVGFESPSHCTQFWNQKTALADADRIDLTVGSQVLGIDAHLLRTSECASPAVTPGVVTVSGVAQVGQTLTADPGTWLPAPVQLAYQWLADGAPVAGATGSTYTLTQAHEGAQLSVRVTGSRPGYTEATATSSAVGPVVPAPLPPVTAGTPTVTGTPVAGQELTADPGSWQPDGVEFTYQWAASGAAIAGATGATFVPGDGEVGKTITVTVTGTKAGYVGSSATSAPTPVVEAAPLLDLTVGSPSVTGTPKVGQELGVSAGTWGPAPVDLGYQWLIDGHAVPGATGATFTPGPEAAGTSVSVTVRATKAGYNPASATSAAVGPVAEGDLVTATPIITGTPRVGEVLTAHAGSWSPSDVVLSYQWFVDGSAVGGPVGGEEGATFTPDAEHIGKRITVQVGGVRPGYKVAFAASAATAAVAPGTIATGQVAVIGEARVGQELRIDAGTWSPAPVALAYQWYADAEPIDGATAETFTPDAALVGSELSVTVTATKPGYADASRTIAVGVVPSSVELSSTSAKPGDQIVVTGEFFAPGEEVQLVLHSDPIELGSVVADDDGTFTARVTIPTAAEPGAHQIIATGTESGRVAATAFTVTGTPAASGGATAATGGRDLAGTGGEAPLGLLACGLVLMAVGATLAGRRKLVR